MHDVNTAQAVTLLHGTAQTLADMAVKLEALEHRMGMNTAVQSTPSPNEPLRPEPAEKQRAPWTWVSGETLPYRKELRDAGGRWSRKRQAWYFMNCGELPVHLRNLPGTNVTVSY